jgi:hypothetical protein
MRRNRRPPRRNRRARQNPAALALAVPALGLLAVLGGLWALFGGGTPATPPTGVHLDAEQTANASVIATAFAGRGYSPTTGKAAIVNAYAESRLRNSAKAAGNEDSRGLFQINSLSGRRNDPQRSDTIAGVDRTNPVANVGWILKVEAAGLAQVDALAKRGGTVAQCAALFCQLVERPSDIPGQMAARSALAQQMYPQG